MLDHAPNCAIIVHKVSWCNCGALCRWASELTPKPAEPTTFAPEPARQAKAA